MANLDIAEKRLPQDGRIALRVGGRPIDVRVSTLPTGHGERAVLRLLDTEAGRLQIETLGLSPQGLAPRDDTHSTPQRLRLVPGPHAGGQHPTQQAATSTEE